MLEKCHTMAQCAQIAYMDGKEAKAEYKKLGFTGHKFIENDGDTKSFDITLKKGGMIIFDEFGFHRGSCPALTDRVVLRFLYRPKNYFYQL